MLKRAPYTLTLILALSACSSNYHRPESIEDKMARFTKQNKNSNLVPDIPVLKFTGKRSSRMPASVDGGQSWDRITPPKSNRRLYFVTLLSQYNHLKEYSPSSSAPVLRSCPSFHTSMVSYSEKYSQNVKKRANLNYTDQKISSELADGHPEFHLPVTMESVHPVVKDIITKADYKERYGSAKEVVIGAINIHISKTYKELTELCEFGSSDNYYSYENLTTHIKKQDKGFPPSKETMGILLKTTLYSNMALLSSLEANSQKSRGRVPASAEKSSLHGDYLYLDAVSERLGVNWTRSYFKRIYR